MPKKYFLFVLACAVSCLVHAQDEQGKSIAELQGILKKSTGNFSRCNAMLDLALGYILKPGAYANDLDSAGSLIREAEADSKKNLNSKATEAKIYFTYSNLFKEKGDRDKGKLYCEKAIDAYKSLLPTDALGEAYFELATYYNWNDAKEQVPEKESFTNALAAFKVTGNKMKQGFALKNMADLDNIMRNYGQALVELQQALDIYKSIGYPQLQGVYDLWGLVANNLGDFPSAVKYGLLAVKTCEAVNDTSLQLCTICFRLGISYDNWTRNHSPEAVFYFQKAFDIALKYNDGQSIFLTITSLCDALCDVGRKQEAVSLLLNNSSRIKMEDRMDSIFVYSHFLQTFRLAGERALAKKAANVLVNYLPLVTGPTDQTLELGYRTLVSYFISQHNAELAEKYADLNLLYSGADPMNKALYLLAYRFKAQADSAAGDFASAFKNQQVYANLKDSLFNEKKSFQFAQMQAAFETEKKDNELRILQVKDALNNAELQRSRQVRNSVIAAAIILLAFFYTGYRFKQRINARLQKKQEEINYQNDILKNTIDEKNQLLTEKEWLVKEIHHRVKNNLQIVISLLNTQSNYLNHEEAISAISDSRRRMQAISFIHEKLYQAENTTAVNMKDYIHELTEYLETSFATGNKITYSLAVEPLVIDIAQAIPLGLILNEAITNSIKYAFGEQDHGCIAITMRKKGHDSIVLEIKDNGKGLPVHFDINKSNSMGMRLIAGLVKQIEGRLTVAGDRGVSVTICFRNHLIV